ncbi:MAG: hypothetical protein LQ347_000616 [Umbilicaria vellea]|nr:MAG: hypothetical protein LQ347_000616 [Umbilicaria vellea]
MDEYVIAEEEKQFCGDPNQELDPESDDERDEQENLVDRSDFDFDHAAQDVNWGEQISDGKIENGGPSWENGTQANPEAEQKTDSTIVQENQPTQVADAEDNVRTAREHIAVVREQLADVQKRFVLAEERLELVLLENQATVRVLDRLEA